MEWFPEEHQVKGADTVCGYRKENQGTPVELLADAQAGRRKVRIVSTTILYVILVNDYFQAFVEEILLKSLR